MNSVNEAVAKYKTLGRIIKAGDVPLAVKLSAVVYDEVSNDDPTGYISIEALAEALYGVSVSVFEGDHDRAMGAVSVAVNHAAARNRKLNG